jgi:hypothetical protein
LIYQSEFFNPDGSLESFALINFYRIYISFSFTLSNYFTFTTFIFWVFFKFNDPVERDREEYVFNRLFWWPNLLFEQRELSLRILRLVCFYSYFEPNFFYNLFTSSASEFWLSISSLILLLISFYGLYCRKFFVPVRIYWPFFKYLFVF